MLNIIKKLFKKEELPKKEINLTDIKNYFDECIKERLAQLEQQLTPLKDSIKIKLEEAKGKVSALSSAGLKNDKLHPREFQLMEGNRDSYVRATNQFLEHVQQKELNAYSAESYVLSFQESLEDYTKSTSRNYMVLQEFFAHESHDVVQAIKELQAEIAKITHVLNTLHTAEMMRIQTLIDRIESRLQASKEYNSSILAKQEEIKSIEKQKLEFASKIKSIENSKEIKEFKEFEIKREALIKEMEQLKEGFYQWFSLIQHALKKYGKQSMEEDFVTLYEQDPVQALMNDKQLHIYDILVKIKQGLDNNTLDLKDTKREKAYEALKVLNKEYLENFVKRYKPVRDEKLKLDHNLRTHKRMLEYNELKYRLEHFNEKIAMIEKEIANLKELQTKKASIDDIKTELVNTFRTVFDVELVING